MVPAVHWLVICFFPAQVQVITLNQWYKRTSRQELSLSLSPLSSLSSAHWHHQLWGTGSRAPPRLPASYFGDHSLYKLWRVMRTVFCPVERFLAIGSADCHWIVALLRIMYKNNAILHNFFLSIFGPFLSFFCPQFSSGSNYSSRNAGIIANKFQLHMYFRFR